MQQVLGWLKLYTDVPKVFILISIVIFPIPYAHKSSPRQKFRKNIEISNPFEPVKVLEYSDSNKSLKIIIFFIFGCNFGSIQMNFLVWTVANMKAINKSFLKHILDFL